MGWAGTSDQQFTPTLHLMCRRTPVLTGDAKQHLGLQLNAVNSEILSQIGSLFSQLSAGQIDDTDTVDDSHAAAPRTMRSPWAVNGQEIVAARTLRGGGGGGGAEFQSEPPRCPDSPAFR